MSTSHASKFRDQDAKKTENRRKNRHDCQIKLRKEKNQQNFAKRRNLIPEEDIDISSDDEPNNNLDINNNDNSNKENLPIDGPTQILAYNSDDKNSKSKKMLYQQINEINGQIDLLEKICSDPEAYEKEESEKTSPVKIKLASLHHCIQSIRKMLSREKQPPIDMVIQSNVVSKIATLLNLDNLFDHDNGESPAGLKLEYFDDEIYGLDPVAAEKLTREQKLVDRQTFVYKIIFESAWILTNICSGTSNQTIYVVNCDADCLDNMIRLLECPDKKVAEQCVWCLGNIVGDGAKLRDRCLESGVVPPLLNFFRRSEFHFWRNATWLLGNLCRNKNPNPTPIKYVEQMLPMIVELLACPDDQVIIDALWAISYLTDGDNARIQTAIDGDILPSLAQILAKCSENPSDNISVLTPCIRSIGNVVTGNDHQTDAVLSQNEILDSFLVILRDTTRVCVQKEVCWTMSNITAGTSPQIQEVLNSGIMPIIINKLGKAEFRVQKEAIWVITNLTAGGDFDQIMETLAFEGGACLKYLIKLLKCNESGVITTILDAIKNFLIHFEKNDRLDDLASMIEELGGLETIEKLQESENEEVYNAAFKLLDEYFNEEDEDIVDAVEFGQNAKTGEFEFVGGGAEGPQGDQFSF